MSYQPWEDRTVPDRYSPTVRKRVLGIQLRKLRNAAGMTGEQAAGEVGLKQGHLSQMEHAKRGVNKAQLLAFMTIYKADEKTRDQLMLLFSTLSKPAWWQGMGVPAGSFVDLEAEAEEIQSFDLALISGLLQTEDYAAAAIPAGALELSDEEVAKRVSVRRQRADLLDEGLKLWTVIDEAALRRHIGGRAVMAAQLEHLSDRAEALPNLTVQVIPFAGGGHMSMESSFAVLKYADHPPLGYVEHWGKGDWLELGYEVDAAISRWNHLSASALDPRKSIDFVRKIAKEMRRDE